jgi:hypothetical protein
MPKEKREKEERGREERKLVNVKASGVVFYKPD